MPQSTYRPTTSSASYRAHVWATLAIGLVVLAVIGGATLLHEGVSQFGLLMLAGVLAVVVFDGLMAVTALTGYRDEPRSTMRLW